MRMRKRDRHNVHLNEELSCHNDCLCISGFHDGGVFQGLHDDRSESGLVFHGSYG